MVSTDALAYSMDKSTVRNRRLREKYTSLSVEEKEARRAKQRKAYQERKARKAVASTDKEANVQQSITIKSVVQQHNKSNSLCKSNAESKAKLKKHVSIFSTFERGSSSTQTPVYKCRRTSRLNIADDPSMCDNCYKFLHETVDDLADISMTVHPQPVEDNASHIMKNPSKNTASVDALNFIRHNADQLSDALDCKYCGAKKFYSETANFCCSDGEVLLHENKLPDILIELFTGQSEEAIHFRTYVRTYNSMFAFTSFGIHYDKFLCKRTNGIYTFKMQGQTYHCINELILHRGSGMYLQLYFHDTEHEIQNRLATSQKVPESIIVKLIEVMKENPYACFFRSLRNLLNLDSYQIVLKSHSDSDQRVFNKPLVSQVAPLWVDGENVYQAYSRHIQIYTKEGHNHRVQYYYDCYDLLQYPLLFRFKETGWHPSIQ
ncbi:uncharacterized protein LOC113759209 [Coffea eugenioides]|uniref:uncharacterized protein LOC113756297 n=1 Tax=Coffea eugenioides TaxID=49369 RepID=UPI000F604D6B|nr:uncharacterized protein LOC113756297 [Coffea eugenioides]XP_027157578.1 uncharacterized protein LOC113759209 [Coffea eugenioides]